LLPGPDNSLTAKAAKSTLASLGRSDHDYEAGVFENPSRAFA
jgi:hypothetical protein